MKRLFFIVAILASMSTMQQAGAQTGTPTTNGCRTNVLVTAPEFPNLPSVPTVAANATPVTQPAAAIPASDMVLAEIEDTASALASCISIGNIEAVGELTTSEFRGDLYGGGERLALDDYLAIAAAAPLVPTNIVSVSNATFDGALSASADIVLVRGHQLFHERWSFLFREIKAQAGTPVVTKQGIWRAHRLEPLIAEPPAGVSRVDVALSEYVTRLQQSSVDGPDVVLAGKNTGKEPHEMLVLQLSGGARVDDLLEPETAGFPAGIAIVGQLTLLPGQSADMTLIDLEPGKYTIVCLLPDELGVPHLAFGQMATLTVK